MTAAARARGRGAGGAVVELDAVHARYGRFHALRGVTFSVPPGVCGLLGPNGAGKSTLVKVLLGLRAHEGRALVLGEAMPSRAAAVRERVGYMPERECHLPGLDAVELCAYGAELCGLPRGEAVARAHHVLEFVGLGDKRYQPVDGYSTGLKQRAKLAAALVHDPELLLLDEPTNGLDPEGRDEMLALIKSLPSRTGCSVLLSTHLLHDVEAICERAVLLHEGQVKYSGSLSRLRSDDRDAYEVRVKGPGEGASAPDERLSKALAGRGCETSREDGMLLAKLPAGATTDLVFATAQELGLQVRHLQPRRGSLEEAFLRVVREPAGAATAGGAEVGS